DDEAHVGRGALVGRYVQGVDGPGRFVQVGAGDVHGVRTLQVVPASTRCERVHVTGVLVRRQCRAGFEDVPHDPHTAAQVDLEELQPDAVADGDHREVGLRAMQRRGRRGDGHVVALGAYAHASISTRPPSGSLATSNAERAGSGPSSRSKNATYGSFSAGQSLMSARNTVVFTTSRSRAPSVVSAA